MNLQDHYSFLRVSPDAPDEEVSRSFKKLALLYHPDRNPGRTAWAHEAMIRLNAAYSAVMAYRFTCPVSPPQPSETKQRDTSNVQPGRQTATSPRNEILDRETLTRMFVQYRETTNDYLYRFYQYGLYHFPRREQAGNQAIYNRIVQKLRASYHGIQGLAPRTRDMELLEHFSVFTTMIFDFYRSAECLNIIDTYSSQREVDAYRIYHQGDEALHRAARELFFDRHNRGFFKRSLVDQNLSTAGAILTRALQVYGDTTWTAEIRIKLSFVQTLGAYVSLFFSGETGLS